MLFPHRDVALSRFYILGKKKHFMSDQYSASGGDNLSQRIKRREKSRMVRVPGVSFKMFTFLQYPV